MTQQTLINFDTPAASPLLPHRPVPVKVRWLRFVADNPGVPRALVQMARDRVAAGDGWVSMRGLFEELRRRPDQLRGGDQVPGVGRVKINNSWTRLATELVIELDPSLRKYFRTR